MVYIPRRAYKALLGLMPPLSKINTALRVGSCTLPSMPYPF
nr:MAG TPA: hypothetical protein [Caudoviricetes sp.]